MTLSSMLTTLLILIVSAIPLTLAVKILGGRASLFKVVLVNIFIGIAVVWIKSVTTLFGGLLAFIGLIFIYKVMFELGWIRALFAWALQFVIAAVLLLFAIWIGVGHYAVGLF